MSQPPTSVSADDLAPVTPGDLSEIADLHAQVFGPGRFARSAYRVREGAASQTAAGHKLCRDGQIIGAVEMTAIQIGGETGGMLLGPLVVAPEFASLGHGRHLVAAACEAAFADGIDYVLLVGDLAYYARAGFQRMPPGRVQLPGPVDPARLLIRLRGSAGALPAGRISAMPLPARGGETISSG